MKKGSAGIADEVVRLCAGLLALAGCSRSLPSGSLVLTESPLTPVPSPARECTLDSRYPMGSRVVLVKGPFRSDHLTLLSEGLVAAGNPLVSYDGRRILFSGKRAKGDDWQIYEVVANGGRAHVLTALPGGASDPVLLADGSCIFVSPVPRLGQEAPNPSPSALYRQSPGGLPHQLTFGLAAVSDPTVLSDGRILFVAAQPSGLPNSSPGLALYTVNNDGTELTAFSGQHAGPAVLRRPRQLADGRIALVVCDSTLASGTAESIRMAMPFHSRDPLLANSARRVCSVEPANDGDWLVCAENPPEATSARRSFALFRTGPRRNLDLPLVADPAWAILEGIEVEPHRAPMGRLSSVDLSKKTGRILCLDANLTASESHPQAAGNAAPATRVRVVTTTLHGAVRVLGEVPLQADGSFLAEVPADIPLGFETLNAQGQTLNRVPPLIWVRPGENRSCIGCHEPHNHSPHNFRPLALSMPSASLSDPHTALALNQP